MYYLLSKSCTISPLQVALTSANDKQRSLSITLGRPNCPNTRRNGSILKRLHAFRYTRTAKGRSALTNVRILDGKGVPRLRTPETVSDTVLR